MPWLLLALIIIFKILGDFSYEHKTYHLLYEILKNCFTNILLNYTSFHLIYSPDKGKSIDTCLKFSVKSQEEEKSCGKSWRSLALCSPLKKKQNEQPHVNFTILGNNRGHRCSGEWLPPSAGQQILLRSVTSEWFDFSL